MRLRIIWPGKTRNAHFRALIEDYLKRLSPFIRCEVTELRETGKADSRSGIDRGSRRISDALQSADLVVLLDSGGVQWSSDELAFEIQRWGNNAIKEVAFVIGGPGGVSRQVVERANKLMSLSRLTFTHEMARVALLEQLYRAFTIIHRLPYHK